jgi:16S rRNA U516 pseudouridylate synthase RsuA-like enzyme
MMGTISNSTVSIHRVRIGPFSLEGLEVGQWRLWTEEEVKELLKVPFDPATKGSDVEME